MEEAHHSRPRTAAEADDGGAGRSGGCAALLLAPPLLPTEACPAL